MSNSSSNAIPSNSQDGRLLDLSVAGCRTQALSPELLLPDFATLSALTATFELKATTEQSGATSKDITNELRTLRTQDGGSHEINAVSPNALKRPAQFEADDPLILKTLIYGKKTFTENGDVANISSKNALVDLFYLNTEAISHDQLDKVLTAAWKEDFLLTLKLIFNARSIHLGKSSRKAAYGALGWLAVHHPKTFLANLHGWPAQ